MAELDAAIKRNQAGEAVLAAYVLDHCLWDEVSGLSKLQLLPTDGKPLSEWDDPSKYWRAVIAGIQAAIKRRQSERKLRTVRAGQEM